MSKQQFEDFVELITSFVQKEASEWPSCSAFEPRIYFLTYTDDDMNVIGFEPDVYHDQDKAITALEEFLPQVLKYKQAHTFAFCRVKDVCMHHFEKMPDEHPYLPVPTLVASFINSFHQKTHLYPVLNDESLGERVEKELGIHSRWHTMLLTESTKTIASRN